MYAVCVRVRMCTRRYVHRLIQNKTDGKVVELPDPTSASPARTQMWHGKTLTVEAMEVSVIVCE